MIVLTGGGCALALRRIGIAARGCARGRYLSDGPVRLWPESASWWLDAGAAGMAINAIDPTVTESKSQSARTS